MDLEFAMYAGVGVGLSVYLIQQLNKTEPLFEVEDAIYNESDKKLVVNVSNHTPLTIYSLPSVRKVAGTQVEKPKNLAKGMLPALRTEKRTLYDLVAQAEENVAIPGNSSVSLVFHMDDDTKISKTDNFIFDASCGLNPVKLKSSVRTPLSMKIKHSDLVARKPTFPVEKSKELIREVSKTESAQPVLDAHPHIAHLAQEIRNDLKPIHGIILHLLEIEGKMSGADFEKKLKKSRASINAQLKYLHENNLLHRVKQGSAYQYLSLSAAVA